MKPQTLLPCILIASSLPTSLASAKDCVGQMGFRIEHADGSSTYVNNPFTGMHIGTFVLGPGDRFIVMPTISTTWCPMPNSARMRLVSEDEGELGTYPPFDPVPVEDEGIYTVSWTFDPMDLEFAQMWSFTIERNSTVGIGTTLEEPGALSVNCTNGVITIATPVPMRMSLELIGMQGAMVHRAPDLSIGPEGVRVPLPADLRGVYLVVLRTDMARHVRRVWVGG